MGAWKTISVGLVLSGMLLGCGQKGPLYREAPAAIAGDAVQDSRRHEASRRENGAASVR